VSRDLSGAIHILIKRTDHRKNPEGATHQAFIFGMFKNYRVYALAEKIRAVYNDPRVQEESVSYIFQTTPAAEPEELMKLVNWGLKLNGSPLSVVFGAALEIDSKAAFRDSYQELYEEAKDMDTELFICFSKLSGKLGKFKNSYFREWYIARLTGVHPTDKKFKALRTREAKILRSRSVLSAFGFALGRGCYLLSPETWRYT